MSTIRIIIADDHQLFRNGLRALLQAQESVEIVGEAETGEALLHQLTTTKADIILLDISLPDKSGLDILPLVREKYPDTKCIMLTMHEELQYVKESLKKGASGYLLKDTSENELREAIRGVYLGKRHFKNKISELLLEDMSGPGSPSPILSEREIEIVKMVAEGKITKEIADKLFISVRTVETHRSRIMKKLGAANASEMINAAYRRKLI
ncbi:MAG: response regulator [Imperialibacter sp.]|jgi:two-component system, NarL family, response regulator NreC|uniref:response regulator transcription factor n=1 Tax=Imperialibacter sp. TaxID=2038411 RepID=UPI0030DBE8D9|tara:strand:- start:8998 stop:9627 length:630 start_codon:yes stop_codon:yes gene_type:complete